MIDPLGSSSKLAGAGLEAQSMRLRVVAENLANANSTGRTNGAEPYTRKTITFRSELDRNLGAASVSVRSLGVDSSEFPTQYDPGHPAADARGMVKMPNVNVLTEMTDMREANRSYEANLQMVKQTRSMVSSLLDLLRG